MAQAETFEIQVLDKGIHCAGCEARIRSVLSKLPGVQQVKAEHKTHLVRLTLDPERGSVEEVREKLKDMGYETDGSHPPGR